MAGLPESDGEKARTDVYARCNQQIRKQGLRFSQTIYEKLCKIKNQRQTMFSENKR